MSEVIVKLTSDHIKVKGGEYVQDIVRCKECRYCLVGVATAQYSNGKQRIENLCEKHKWSVRADDFCSYGERSSE